MTATLTVWCAPQAGGQKGHKGTTLTKYVMNFDVTYGSYVKALAVALYSEGVMSNDRIASFLNQAVVSTDATVVTVNGKQNFIRDFSVKAQPSGQMLFLLCEINEARKALMVEGISTFFDDMISTYEKNYIELLHKKCSNTTLFVTNTLILW